MSLADRTPPNDTQYADDRKRFSSWGRWGGRDELRTLNVVTPYVRRQAAAEGIEPAAGDAVLIRSGLGPYFEMTGTTQGFGSPADVHASCVEFLDEAQASCLIWDFQDAPIAEQGLTIRWIGRWSRSTCTTSCFPNMGMMGMPTIDNADFEPLASAGADRERWAFQLVVAQLLLESGTGSPVDPIAVL